MRDFSKTPITGVCPLYFLQLFATYKVDVFLDNEGVNKWLKFFEMSAPLIALGTFTSNDGVCI